jgi:O-acetyl-ADP-ribose deacetylase (regulator of RNase III)
MSSLNIVRGDITQLTVDAIVNAANRALLGGGGVDGAIHRAAGPRLFEACRQLPELQPGVRCPTGEARITPGFDLRAKFVIHTVGPVFDAGNAGEDALLAACYRNCLELAAAHGVRSLAFPAISCGVYGFPASRAARIAVREIQHGMNLTHGTNRTHGTSVQDIVLVAFDTAMQRCLEEAVALAAP